GTATKLQTARTLTVGATGKAFNGEAPLSWTLAEIGAQAAHANLAALAGLTGAADRMPYFTGAGALSLAVLTAAARTFLAASTQAAQRTALNLFTDASGVVTEGSGALPNIVSLLLQSATAAAARATLGADDASNLTKGTIPAARVPTLNQSTTGNAATATKLATDITINGVKVNAGSNATITAEATSASVMAANAAAAVGAVGTYAFLLLGGQSTGVRKEPGSTVAGSGCRYTAVDGTGSTSPAGTWSVMGWAGDADGGGQNSVTLCKRIA
ncbi:hypothetical protein SAMN05421672_110170, partial [Pseudomonas flexibilis]